MSIGLLRGGGAFLGVIVDFLLWVEDTGFKDHVCMMS